MLYLVFILVFVTVYSLLVVANDSNQLYICCFRSRSRKIIENIRSQFKIQIEVSFDFFTNYK